MKKVVVMYHANCNDGFGAALCAWKFFGKEAEYMPVSYNEPAPVFPTDKNLDLYILDFCFPFDVIDYWAGYHNIVILDHHKTAEETIDRLNSKYPNIVGIYKKNRSGAGISWQYFHGREEPALIKYIEDRDLWLFRYGYDTKACHRLLDSISKDFMVWNNLFNDTVLNNSLERYIHIEEYITTQVIKVSKTGKDIDLLGNKCRIVMSSLFQSEIGSYIVNNFDINIAAVVTIDNSGLFKVSLRSLKGGVDVSKIAKVYGGGGHQAAAGFVIDDLKKLDGTYAKAKQTIQGPCDGNKNAGE